VIAQPGHAPGPAASHSEASGLPNLNRFNGLVQVIRADVQDLQRSLNELAHTL
jgi:hypothetical protein